MHGPSLRSLRRTGHLDVRIVCAEKELDSDMVGAIEATDLSRARWFEPGMSYTGWIALS